MFSPRCLRRFSLVVGLAVAAAAGLLSGCGAEEPVAEKAPAEFFPIKLGDRVVRLQLAVLPAERQRGLMYRKQLGADEGMLFVHPQPERLSYWMRNVDLPLDVGFFDGKGELREIRPMYPHDERPVASRAVDLQIAVEMNQNWYRDQGVRTGAKLDVEALKTALRARGFEPRRLGLD